MSIREKKGAVPRERAQQLNSKNYGVMTPLASGSNGSKRKWHPFVRLLGYFRPYWARLLGALILIGAAEGIRLYFVWLTQDLLKPMIYTAFQDQPSGWFIDNLKAFAQLTITTSPRFAQLVAICIAVIILGFGRALFSFGHNFLTNQVCQKVIINLRRKVYAHLQLLSPSFYESQSTGRLLSHLTNDLNVLQLISAIGVQDIVAIPLQMLGAFVLMVQLSWRLTLVAMLIVPLVAWVIYITGRRIRAITERMQSRMAELTHILDEALASMSIVQAFGVERDALERFQNENVRVYRETMRNVRIRAALGPLVEFIALCGVAIGLWFGGHEVVTGHMRPESLVPFMIYFHMLAMGFRNMSRLNAVREQVTAAAQRLFAILDTPPDIRDHPEAIELERASGHIQFRGVTFTYPTGRRVLDRVTFEIKSGETVALVGPSGAGKTTIVRLLLRLYEPQDGEILLDGYDIRRVKLHSLRRLIGIVPQDVVLFDGTIRDNIAFGKPEATDEEVMWAAQLAHAHEFISQLPDGYNTVIGERGVRLSMGQRQRIAIARAILRDPPILILDEATSNLDSESEVEVQRALEAVRRGRTTLIIAHRLSTIRDADRILVIHDGGIVEEGSHDELLARHGLYQRLYNLQFAQDAIREEQ
ncbi:MAG TPA: ABC transporter ATP-binding protein [Armatimonadetes bacterium]|nr:ABC transporter ATP-binding protein [Armatimonadota bacterium]